MKTLHAPRTLCGALVAAGLAAAPMAASAADPLIDARVKIFGIENVDAASNSVRTVWGSGGVAVRSRYERPLRPGCAVGRGVAVATWSAPVPRS